MGKKKIILYGNCQTTVISRMLNDHPIFNKEFDMVGFRPHRKNFVTHKMKMRDIARLENELKDTDVFIYHSISKSYRGEQFSSDYLKSLVGGRCMWLFNYWFRGYTPGEGFVPFPYLKLGGRPGTPGGGPMRFDVMLFWLYSSGKSPHEAFDWLESAEDEMVSEFVLKAAKDDIAELKRRQTEQINLGNEVVGMSDVMNSWREIQLGITINHPTMHYYWEICSRILDALDMDNSLESWSWKGRRLLTSDDYPKFFYTRNVCPDIDFIPYPIGGQLRWDIDYVHYYYEIFKENYDAYLGVYQNHLINKFFPL